MMQGVEGDMPMRLEPEVALVALTMLISVMLLAWLGRAASEANKARAIAGRQIGKEKRRSRMGSR
jgi:hypothetical protein